MDVGGWARKGLEQNPRSLLSRARRWNGKPDPGAAGDTPRRFRNLQRLLANYWDPKNYRILPMGERQRLCVESRAIPRLFHSPPRFSAWVVRGSEPERG